MGNYVRQTTNKTAKVNLGRSEQVKEMMEDELKRLRANDLTKPMWFEFRQRRWIDGVKITREVAAQKLEAIYKVYCDG